jgi:thymidylate synthase ThyX
MDVIVLDGNEVPSPEDMAMIQALYSRSPQSVRLHLEQVQKSGSEKFHERYYVQYGHKSIGDCGTITICIENVSMIVAKAIQDNPLYNGQEASTRYLDFAERPNVNPAQCAEGGIIQKTWITLYKEVLASLIPAFEARFPREEGQKKGVWKKAVKARAFDVARGFLPAGATTFVAWHTNLRQAHDHLQLMKHNPCAEVREVAGRVHEELLKRYPSSFGHKVYQASEDYLAKSVERFAFSQETRLVERSDFLVRHRFDLGGLSRHRDLLVARPPKTELHQRMRQYGDATFEFFLDFGSYRDLQRHRSCVQEMPLLTTRYGIHNWYLEQLDDTLLERVCEVAALQEERIAGLDVSAAEKQYYVAMSYANPIKITCSLPSAVYIAELRSGTTVHPTVRVVAQQIGEALLEIVPGLTLHHDMSDGVWDIKRGAQDILVKKES